jgi:hypothetical protein
MTGTLGLALYAAAIGTASLAWQIASWRLGRRTTVEVLVSGQFFLKVGEPVIFVKAVNRSSHPINVQGVGLHMPDGRIFMPPHPDGATLPGVLQPRDSGFTYFPLGGLSGLVDVHGPVTAEVSTAVGNFKSKPTVALPSTEQTP